MNRNSSLVRNILFNILVVLTIIFIYMIFFPKKGYVEIKLSEELNPIIDEIFNQNINSIKIASQTYFNENSNSTKVTVATLIDNNLLTDLKDSTGNTCNSQTSYAENKNSSLSIYLSCPEKEEIIEVFKETDNNDKLICIYEYRKELPTTYTDWSDFSKWSTEEKISNELTNVETKTEKVFDRTETVTESKQVNVEAIKSIKITCPNGYKDENGKCKKEITGNTITASISYSCPNGYKKNGIKCYKDSQAINATKKYYCPSNKENIKFELVNDKCNIINIRYINSIKTEEYYSCPTGYNLSNNKCYKNETITKEVEIYKDVTYYRYQTREKQESKYDIKWSTINDTNLINNEYNMIREIFCEI